jgi:hypothetical protein
MKLFNFKYGPELERTISIDLDRIIFISDTLDDDCVLVISVETKVKNITDHFEFPSKEYRDSVHFNILRASYSSVILPTRE